MTQELIISISGMRGLIGENLFPETAVAYGSAFAAFLRQYHKGKSEISVAIGRDSRPSGHMICSAVTAGLTACGVNVVDLGICTTPGVGIMLRHLKCDGGVIITASHNPAPYNGIKLLLDNGIAPPPASAQEIIQIYRERAFCYCGALNCGQVTMNDRAARVHVDKVLPLIDKARIASRRFKVVLDSVNGAGGPSARLLLEELGCTVIPMNVEPTGIFAHTPEPTAENLISLCAKVKECSADIGFAQDPDADRLAIVDESGVYIGEEFTLALAAKYVYSKQKGSAAANLSTSRMIDDIAAAAGCSVIRTPVGEANVAKAMIENDCIIGGEGNGGVIDLRVGPIRDSLTAMAMVLQLMAETGRSVSQLADQVGGYTIYKSKYPADRPKAEHIIAEAKKVFPEAIINTRDGCRFDLPEGWIHIRTSNTEPVMRIIMETRNPDVAAGWMRQLEAIVS